VGKNPTDRGKIGTKRSVLTDGSGVPIGLAVEGANRHDFKMARATIASIPVARPAPTPEQPQVRGLDNGDDFDEVCDLLAECGLTAHIRTRGEEAYAIKQEAGYLAGRALSPGEAVRSYAQARRPGLLVRGHRAPVHEYGMYAFVGGTPVFPCQ
jgi:hypothetical protein